MSVPIEKLRELAAELDRDADKVDGSASRAMIAMRTRASDIRALIDAAKPMPATCKERLRVAIDCEFNGKDGELISMALVAEDGREFYEVLPLPERVDPWVAEHVVPILGKAPISKAAFQTRLREFLMLLGDPLIVSDWPVDIAYLCEWVIVGEYPMCTAPMIHAVSMSLPNTPASAIPHNALEDARAICKALPTVKDSLTVAPATDLLAYLAKALGNEWSRRHHAGEMPLRTPHEYRDFLRPIIAAKRHERGEST